MLDQVQTPLANHVRPNFELNPILTPLEVVQRARALRTSRGSVTSRTVLRTRACAQTCIRNINAICSGLVKRTLALSLDGRDATNCPESARNAQRLSTVWPPCGGNGVSVSHDHKENPNKNKGSSMSYMCVFPCSDLP